MGPQGSRASRRKVKMTFSSVEVRTCTEGSWCQGSGCRTAQGRVTELEGLLALVPAHEVFSDLFGLELKMGKAEVSSCRNVSGGEGHLPGSPESRTLALGHSDQESTQ